VIVTGTDSATYSDTVLDQYDPVSTTVMVSAGVSTAIV
jgi:hypothetical protein